MHFADGNVWNAINTSLKIVIEDTPAEVEIVAWCRPGYYLNRWCLVYWQIYAALGLKNLNSVNVSSDVLPSAMSESRSNRSYCMQAIIFSYWFLIHTYAKVFLTIDQHRTNTEKWFCVFMRNSRCAIYIQVWIYLLLRGCCLYELIICVLLTVHTCYYGHNGVSGIRNEFECAMQFMQH